MTELSFSILNMSSVNEDRTARARVRDAALELFAEHGEDRVTMRQVAERAGVSPALVVHHFGSREGLREAVVEHVRGWLDELFERATQPDIEAGFRSGEWAAAAELAMAAFPRNAPEPNYLRRLLMSGDPLGVDLLRRWHHLMMDVFRAYEASGLIVPGPDLETRAAMRLSLGMGLILLHDQWAEVLGYDPLEGEGVARWAEEGSRIFAAILNPDETPPSSQENP